MSKPVILLTTSNVSEPGFAKTIGDTDIIYSDRATALAVIRAGGIPLYMPGLTELNKQDVKNYLNLADGVLVTGADTDTNPTYYGESATHMKSRIDDERDQTDLALIRAAYQKRKPLLGICKGMQLINVALGGTLYQSIADQCGTKIDHAVKNSRTKVTHQAKIAKGSILEQIFGGTTFGLNGGHKQGIKSLSTKLYPIAVAEDGIVEAYEGSNYPFLLGMQFHIELRLAEQGFLNIFERFIAAASQR